MAIAPPPVRPSSDDLEALIREARQRGRRRRLATAAIVGLAAGIGLALWAAMGGGSTVEVRGHGPIRATAGHTAATTNLPPRGIGDVGSAGGVTWAVNGHGIWLTTNRGRTWLRSVPRGIAAARIAVASPPDVQFVNKRDGWMSAPLAFDRQELLKASRHWEFDRTTDGGRTWQLSLPPGCLKVCYDGSFSFLDARHGYLLADVQGAQAPNKLFSTSDGGRTWQLVSRPAIWGPITFVNHDTAFAGGPGPTIIGPYIGPPIVTLYRTTDGGRTWSKYDIAGSDSFVDLPIRVFGPRVVLAQNAPNHAGGLNLNPGTVDVSPDGGHNWLRHAVPFGPGGLPASFSAVSPSVWAFSSRHDLFTTRDSGRHWRKIVLRNLPTTAQVKEVVFTSSRVGWAVVYGFGPHGDLFRTTDGGLHWTVAGPPLPRARTERAKPRLSAAFQSG
jgi:photosystem II stability/assembly factor-like uncharacterized protein